MQNLPTLQAVIDKLPEYGDRPALLALQKEGIERRSYAQLADQVRRLAQGLAETGIEPADHVALLASNRPEWVAACLAVIRAGAVVVPLDVQLADDVLRHALKDSDARLVFTTAAQADRLKRLKIKKELQPILLDAEADDKRGWQRLLADKAGDLPQSTPDDPAALFYTSGTTGLPKGVPLTHGNLAFQLNALAQARLVSEEDRVLLPLPLHHVYPFVIGMLAPLTLGLGIVLPQVLTGPQLVRALQEGQVTTAIGVPRLYRALAAGIWARSEAAGRIAAALFRAGAGLCTWLRRRLGLRLGKLLLRPLHRQFGSRLRVLVSGGAALDPDLAWELEGLGWQLATGYGLTETAPILTFDPPGRARIGSVGRPLPGVEVRIDPAAGPEEGEILARGPNVFTGYRNLPEKTAEAFTADGWFRTGDLGHFDGDGYLYVTGRVATRITTEGGKKFQPDDVEEAYQASPVLREVGVLQKDGKLVALIVPGPGAGRERGDDSDRAIRDAVAERSKGLPSYERVTEYAVTRESLPRTHLGKIRRQELAERYDRAKKGEQPDKATAGTLPPEEMSDEDRALLEDESAKQVWDWLAARYPDRRLTPDTSPQFDLGVDSMEWLNLTLEIRQRAGVELTDEAIGRIETVRDLLREVAGQGEAGQAAQAPPLEQPEEALSDRQKRWLEPLGPVQSILSRCMWALNSTLMRGLFRLRADGLENLPGRGPFILVPNHNSYLDSPALAAALGYRRLRQTYWAGWTGVAFRNPLTRLMSRLAQVVPVEPERAALSSLAFAAAVLKRGKNLVWFAEGGFSPTGALQPFKPGIGILLEHFDVPVVPVFLHGTRTALPPGTVWPRRKAIRVVFGEPLDAASLAQQAGDGDDARDQIVHTLHDRVEELGRRSSGSSPVLASTA